MDFWPSEPPPGTTLVVADGLAARQWHACFARGRIAAGQGAWLTPPVSTYRSWAETIWSELETDDCLLSSVQASALWRRVIEQSQAGRDLLSVRAAARWAEDAWWRLHAWRLDLTMLNAGAAQDDFATFLSWAKAYNAELRSRRWLDGARLDAVLAERLAATKKQVLIDLPDVSPAQLEVLARFERMDWPVRDARQSEVRRIGLTDPEEELWVAAHWARRRIERTPSQRIALVIPALSTRQEEVKRVLDHALARGVSDSPLEYALLEGEPALRDPMIGAALTALELLCGHGTFPVLSRWLRSPFFATGSADAAARASLEIDLREALVAQLGFLQAYRAGGLRERILLRSPALVKAFDAASARLRSAPRRMSATAWSELWQQLLADLGWHGHGSDPVRESWEDTLADVGALTPILGPLTGEEALRELRSALSGQRRLTPLPPHGVYVLERLEDLGPGYDAAWVCGLTDQAWPRPASSNPMLPLGLQLRAEMPRCSPSLALDACRRHIRRLIERVPHLVLSWPRRIDELETEPSPLIIPFEETRPAELIDPPFESGRIEADAMQLLDDTPPALTGSKIPGGASALSAQAVCPLRAFLEHRLHARPLPRLASGINAKQRGVVIHRALQLLLDPQRTSAVSIDAAVRRALGELFGGARDHLRTLFALEAEQVRDILAQLLALDARRAEFEIAAVEHETTVQLGRWQIKVRIDRIDRLPDGTLVVIDYKSAGGARPTDWVGERLRDVQIPLYCLAAPGRVGAAAVARLRPQGVRYIGWWRQGVFPGRPASFHDGRDLSYQLEQWQAQIQALADAYASGDGHVLQSEKSHVEGALAPLSRIRERMALAEGWLNTVAVDER